MAQFVVDPSALAPALTHVVYEIRELLTMVSRVFATHTAGGLSPTVSQPSLRPFIESAVMHARNLGDFFDTDVADRRRDDVLCIDFGYLRASATCRAPLRARMNKYVEHLTYSRVTQASGLPHWTLADFRPVLAESRAFLASALREVRFAPAAGASEISTVVDELDLFLGETRQGAMEYMAATTTQVSALGFIAS